MKFFSCLLCFGLLSFSVTSFAQYDLTVSDYSGLKQTFGINKYVEGNTTYFTPVKRNCGLDIADLSAALKEGDVVLKTTDGDILFVSGLLNPTEVSGKLSLESSGKIIFSFDNNFDKKINLSLKAAGDIDITTASVNTNGGKFESFARNTTIGGGGLNTKGGHVTICSEGFTKIYGSGIRTMNGRLVIDSQSLDMSMDGVDTGRGVCDINTVFHTYIDGRGIRCGNFISSGVDLNVRGDGIDLKKGKAILLQRGNIYLLDGGLKTQGGSLFISGNDLTVGGDEIAGGSGIMTLGGKITGQLKGNVVVRARGIYSGNGSIRLVSRKNIVVRFGGITTSNAPIYIESLEGTIDLGGMNLNTNIGPKVGVGKLDTSTITKGTLLLQTEPVLGGANITIRTHKTSR